MYKDREAAAYILAEQLKKYKGQDGVVLAIPRGAVPMGVIIAEELGFDLDLALSKKIGHPHQKEYAIGAVSLTDCFINDHDDVPHSYIIEEVKRIRTRLSEMYKQFMGDKEPVDVNGKIAIIVDDGIATGNTMLSTVRMIKKQDPHHIIIAVPVASRSAIDLLSSQVDELICPLVPEYFVAVGGFYENFDQVSDEEVKFYMDRFQHKKSASES
jgi:predicted phosphoribosyltransferase